MSFTFVSGHAGLDLAGTVGHRDTPDRYDLLTGPDALASWIVQAGLVGAAAAVDAEGLAETTELREAIYRLATARIQGTAARSADRDLLNSTAAAPPVTPRLREDGAIARGGELSAVRSTIARATIELLGAAAAAQLKACGAAPCTRIYLDSSRRGDRRWCDMRECGNRAKAASYRKRHAADRAGS
jgi:predicted RNA-binding Zn ribbon-like protein